VREREVGLVWLAISASACPNLRIYALREPLTVAFNLYIPVIAHHRAKETKWVTRLFAPLRSSAAAALRPKQHKDTVLSGAQQQPLQHSHEDQGSLATPAYSLSNIGGSMPPKPAESDGPLPIADDDDEGLPATTTCTVMRCVGADERWGVLACAGVRVQVAQNSSTACCQQQPSCRLHN